MLTDTSNFDWWLCMCRPGVPEQDRHFRQNAPQNRCTLGIDFGGWIYCLPKNKHQPGAKVCPARSLSSSAKQITQSDATNTAILWHLNPRARTWSAMAATASAKPRLWSHILERWLTYWCCVSFLRTNLGGAQPLCLNWISQLSHFI